jgi:hypothetical protein
MTVQADGLAETLLAVLQSHLTAGDWQVIALVGRQAVPAAMREWCQETVGTPSPILLVLHERDRPGAAAAPGFAAGREPGEEG